MTSNINRTTLYSITNSQVNSSIKMARRFHKAKQRIKPYADNLKLDKSCQNLAEARKFILNLSRHKLNDNEYSLLAKELKFIPSLKQKNIKRRIFKDFDEFDKKIKMQI